MASNLLHTPHCMSFYVNSRAKKFKVRSHASSSGKRPATAAEGVCPTATTSLCARFKESPRRAEHCCTWAKAAATLSRSPTNRPSFRHGRRWKSPRVRSGSQPLHQRPYGRCKEQRVKRIPLARSRSKEHITKPKLRGRLVAPGGPSRQGREVCPHLLQHDRAINRVESIAKVKFNCNFISGVGMPVQPGTKGVHSSFGTSLDPDTSLSWPEIASCSIAFAREAAGSHPRQWAAHRRPACGEQKGQHQQQQPQPNKEHDLEQEGW